MSLFPFPHKKLSPVNRDGDRSKAQRGGAPDAAGDGETINNLTNNCHRGGGGDSALVAVALPTPGVKNINKKMDFCGGGGPDEGPPPGRSSYKPRLPPADYNLVHELNQEQAAKEALLEAARHDQCHAADAFEFEEQRGKRLKW